ncbi:energy transducer TonB [Xylophilus sp. ASV27]|uniref:energy transducer TonB n=1 Tax=Xylophilus sp. ASV27 TaxID=2795129 RepID=UPI0018EA9D40|nr:energy transducer TonB [Xylophilus sp. ASV27]
MSRSKDFDPKSRFGPVGIGLMVLFHVLIGYALVSGLARQTIELTRKPMDATIITEVKLPPPPPPPPPPPKKIVRQEAPRTPPPPRPAYVPPPAVAPPESTAPAITAVQSTEPVAPPPAAPPAPAAPPTPPAPQRAASTDIAVACPKQVRPEMPRKALDEGISGVVVVEVRIKGNHVTDVRFVSGPRVYQAAVRAAVMRYECQTTGDAEILATQEFIFKFN